MHQTERVLPLSHREKTTEVLCLLVEGQQLRNAIRAEPRTRLWTYCDLSPDCRAIEQFGMGVEYAGIDYQRSWLADADTPAPTLAFVGRLSGEAGGVCMSVPIQLPRQPFWPKGQGVAILNHRRPGKSAHADGRHGVKGSVGSDGI